LHGYLYSPLAKGGRGFLKSVKGNNIKISPYPSFSKRGISQINLNKKRRAKTHLLNLKKLIM